MSTTEDELDKFQNAFGEWLQVHGVELDDLLDYGEWKANIDMNKLKAGFMSLLNTELDKQLKEAERFNYDFGYKDGQNGMAVELDKALIDGRKAMGERLNKAIFFSTTQPKGQFVKDCILAELNSAEEDRLASLKENI